MATLCLNILPVYSEYDPMGTYFSSQRLLWHQVETLEAFQNPDIDVIINQAMTGDGKSLAGYLPSFQERQAIIAMYPTNELIKDQYCALKKYQTELGVALPTYNMMFRERITQLMREHDEKVRLEEVKKLLMHSDILLTNPDIVHLIMSHQYGWNFMRKELPVITGTFFEYFLFDEFHIFAIPQIISVVNMLGYLHTAHGRQSNERRKYVFLSATPTPLLTRLLERSGLNYKVIKGHYSSIEDRQKYRCILQGCEISLETVNQERTMERWVEEHLPELLQFFLNHMGSKAAILVYSPATARRLLLRLEEYFRPHGISVGEITGLTETRERPAARGKDILIGTTTIDIGIDFQINYLVFEAFNAGSFLQRFGRLGRHAGFPVYRAYALISDFILERLTERFKGERDIERTILNTAVREAYPMEQEFAGYTQRWGTIQAAHVLEELRSQRFKDANQEFTNALIAQYERIYGTAEKPVMAGAGKKYRVLKQAHPEVLDDLLSFRGQSRLDCGVWDVSPIPGRTEQSSLLTYDLFFLLSNANFEVIEPETFMHEVRRRGLEERDFLGKRFYLKVHSYVPERLNLVLGLPLILSEHPETLHQLMVRSRFFISDPPHPWRDQISKTLGGLKIPCIASDLQPLELRRQLQLGGIFPLYQLIDQLGSCYTVAFGQHALLLESILTFRKTRGNNAIMA